MSRPYAVLLLLTLFCILNFCCVAAADARHNKQPAKDADDQIFEMEKVDGSDTGLSDRDNAKLEKEKKNLSKQKNYTPFLGQTSDEIMNNFRSIVIDNVSKEKLKQIFLLSDLVKFAKEQPLPNENELSLNNAVEFVNITKEEKENNIKEQLPTNN